MSCHLISMQQDIRNIKIQLNLTSQRGKAKEETCSYLLGPYLIIISSFNKCNRMRTTLYFFFTLPIKKLRKPCIFAKIAGWETLWQYNKVILLNLFIWMNNKDIQSEYF